jgi:hypothetical protein
MFCGVSALVSTKFRVPLNVPTMADVNLTATAQEAPGATLLPQLLV